MARTRHVPDLFLAYPLHKYVHHSTADLVVSVGGLGEVDRDDPWLTILEDRHGFLPDFRLSAAAADGAEERAVPTDDHLGAGFARSRPAGARDGGEHHRFAPFEGAGEGAINLILHALIVPCSGEADNPGGMFTAW